MECPACGRALAERTVGGLTVDVCRGGCGGIWFDQLELKKVDEPHEALGEELLSVERDPSVVVDFERRRTCPRCVGQVMMRHYFSIRRQVEVDECPRCAGFFLDAGELHAIREQFGSEDDKNAAAQAAFSDQFAPQLDALRAESEKKATRARSVARLFRFILPSYYIPGKQDWGAY
jgi:Zn-finger nucleic acid-binding protein